MKKKSILIVAVLYLVSSIGSYAGFSFAGKSSTLPGSTKVDQAIDGEESPLSLLLEIDPSEPLDQACPLNGQLYTNTERQAWEQRRPMAVMIENTPDSRPQSGLADSDIVFEAVAEGGVTRFMALFYCDVQKSDTTLAPIRSARTYYVDYASGFNLPLYVHVGGANVPGPTNALGQIGDYGWNGQNDINQFSVGYPTFVRDYNRIPGKEIATEHTMVTSTEKIWDVAEEREWTNLSPERKYGREVIEAEDWKDGYIGWTFEDAPGEKGDVSKISYDFWSGYDTYSVSWEYNSETNRYMRSQAGEKHIDMNTDEQVSAANVVVLLTTEKGPINEKKHMIYGTTGTGDALIFKNGQAIEAEWYKKSRTSELSFKDAKGNDIEMARGLTWISVVNLITEVEY
ncbi:MAG: DUF3048 domain-containing protein [Candidatus Pacebacteria bacterium]|nr:DUF3048 domain-containing protein [Candidatus Paceibacterota bacterium]